MLDKGTGNKQWIERGIGIVKFLQHNENQRIRILMRQEKTMKIIINHLLVPGLVLCPHETNDRATIWNARDFSEGELIETTFCLRFGSTELLDAFKAEFKRCQEIMQRIIDGEDAPSADGGAAVDEAAAALEGLSAKDDAPAADEAAPSSEE